MCRLFSLLALAATGSLAIEPVYPPQEHFEPGAAVVELARQRDIPLSGIERDPERTLPAVGDQCVVLVSLRQGKQVEQWLVTFELADFTAEERASLANHPPRPFTLHASTGAVFEFVNDPVPIDVWVAGPLKIDESRVQRAVSRVKEKRTRFSVNREYLGIGLARAAAAILRLRNDQGKVGIGVSGEPFPAEETAITRASLAERGVSDAEVGYVVRSAPALMEYLNITARTPGLRDIMFEVVDLPWMSLISNLGIDSINLSTDGSNLRPVPGETNRYILPLQVNLNGSLAMMVEMKAGAPAAPASLLAGVTELYAGRPNGEKARLAIRLLAATTTLAPEE